jgi:hypothetical protein
MPDLRRDRAKRQSVSINLRAHFSHNARVFRGGFIIVYDKWHDAAWAKAVNLVAYSGDISKVKVLAVVNYRVVGSPDNEEMAIENEAKISCVVPLIPIGIGPLG